MNLESDSEFQAYMSQLYKKSQEFKFEENSSDDISAPSHLGSTSSNKSDRTNINIQKYFSKDKTNAAITLEKSIKKTASFPEHEVSLVANSDFEAVSKNRPNSKSEKSKTDSSKVSTARTDEILNMNNVMSFNDLVNVTNKTIDDATALSDIDDSANVSFEEKDFDISNRQLSYLNEKENKNIFYATNKAELQRQSSTSSLLLPREGLFYADKTKRKNSILVFKDEVVWTRESNQGSINCTTDSKMSPSESIEEDLPAHEVKVRSKKESKESLLSTVTEAKKKNIPIRNDEKLFKNKNEGTTNRKALKSLKTTNDVKKRNKSSSETKSCHSVRKHSLEKSCNIRTSSPLESPTERSNNKSSHRRCKTKPMSVSSRKHICKSLPLASSTSSSSSESTDSSSLSIKIEKKKSNRKKYKSRLKDKDLLVELIIKTLVKVLPKLQPSLYQEMLPYSYPMAPLLVPACRKSVVAASNNVASMFATSTIPQSYATMSTDRIDAALRETVALTRQFLDTHQTLYEAYSNMLKKDSKYSSAQKVEEILNKRSPSASLNDAYRVMKELKNKKRKEGTFQIGENL